MGFSKDTLKKAFAIKKAETEKAQAEHEKSLQNAYASYKELEEIEKESAKIGAEIITTAFSGDSEKLKELKIKSTALKKQKDGILLSAGVKKVKPFCKKCNDSGYFEGKVCECIKEIAKQIEISELSLKMPIKESTFQKFDISYYPDEDKKKMQKILDYCISYSENFSQNSKNLLFIGNPGLGKTHLSLAIVNEAVKKGHRVIYGSAGNIFGEIEKEHFSYTGLTEKQDAVLDADLLVIDDLGTEFSSSFVNNLFYNIVNSRILTKKPTIINTNLSFEDLEKKYTARITSRFIGEYDIKIFFGQDIRLLKKAKKQ